MCYPKCDEHWSPEKQLLTKTIRFGLLWRRNFRHHASASAKAGRFGRGCRPTGVHSTPCGWSHGWSTPRASFRAAAGGQRPAGRRTSVPRARQGPHARGQVVGWWRRRVHRVVQRKVSGDKHPRPVALDSRRRDDAGRGCGRFPSSASRRRRRRRRQRQRQRRRRRRRRHNLHQ